MFNKYQQVAHSKYRGSLTPWAGRSPGHAVLLHLGVRVFEINIFCASWVLVWGKDSASNLILRLNLRETKFLPEGTGDGIQPSVSRQGCFDFGLLLLLGVSGG